MIGEEWNEERYSNRGCSCNKASHIPKTNIRRCETKPNTLREQAWIYEDEVARGAWFCRFVRVLTRKTFPALLFFSRQASQAKETTYCYEQSDRANHVERICNCLCW